MTDGEIAETIRIFTLGRLPASPDADLFAGELARIAEEWRQRPQRRRPSKDVRRARAAKVHRSLQILADIEDPDFAAFQALVQIHDPSLRRAIDWPKWRNVAQRLAIVAAKHVEQESTPGRDPSDLQFSLFVQEAVHAWECWIETRVPASKSTFATVVSKAAELARPDWRGRSVISAIRWTRRSEGDTNPR